MRVVCVVQARMGSSRLPGKSLRVLAGRPLIDHVFRRARAIRGVDDVVLATTYSPLDNALVDRASEPVHPHRSVPVYRGSEKDVLLRYVEVATLCSADVVMRITGDCPFLAPEVAEEVLKVYFDNPLESVYVSNDTTCSGYPDGMDVEVFSFKALRLAHLEAKSAHDREHVTSWMRRSLTHAILKSDVNYAHHKLSVDTPRDYDYAAKLAAALPRGEFSLDTTMRTVLTLRYGSPDE